MIAYTEEEVDRIVTDARDRYRAREDAARRAEIDAQMRVVGLEAVRDEEEALLDALTAAVDVRTGLRSHAWTGKPERFAAVLDDHGTPTGTLVTAPTTRAALLLLANVLIAEGELERPASGKGAA